jgi:ParB-like chromosome segregation protein Spo0J
MNVTTMPLSMLRPAPCNPRQELKPKDPRYRRLRRSLQQFGLVEPLVWNQRSGHLIGGHQRLKILRELGWNEVPVSVVDLTPEQERALNLVLNNREAQSDWDVARLRDLLEEIVATPECDLRDTGFEIYHLEMLRDRLDPEPLAAAQEDAIEGVEVILRLTQEQYEMLRPELDALVDRHGLECHVRCI